MSKPKTDERTPWQALREAVKVSTAFGESDRWRRIPSWPVRIAVDRIITRTLYRRP